MRHTAACMPACVGLPGRHCCVCACARGRVGGAWTRNPAPQPTHPAHRQHRIPTPPRSPPNQCVTAVEPEWLAELGPLFFSIKETHSSRLEQRQKVGARAHARRVMYLCLPACLPVTAAAAACLTLCEAPPDPPAPIPPPRPPALRHTLTPHPPTPPPTPALTLHHHRRSATRAPRWRRR